MPGNDINTEISLAVYDVRAAALARRYAALSMAPQMNRLAGLLSPGIILDAGCGSGRDLAAWQAAGYQAVGLDRSWGMLGQARVAGRPLTRGDMRQLPFADRSFAGIWASASLVHLDQSSTMGVLREFRRVTRPGAALYVGMRLGTDTGNWGRPSLETRWYYSWRPSTLAATFRQAGFEVLGLDVDKDIWLNVFCRRP
jgi:ubiquinone/menaquinone biosynthesis C-methylase UbiE